MEEIIKGLYLGDETGVPEAKRRGYSILSCCKDGPQSHRSLLRYTTHAAPKNSEYLFAKRGKIAALNLIDSDDPDMIPDAVIDAGLGFIKEQMDKGNKIFVHCNAGHSRSPSLVMLYLHSIGELSQGYQRAKYVFKTIYPPFRPNDGMEAHLKSRW